MNTKSKHTESHVLETRRRMESRTGLGWRVGSVFESVLCAEEMAWWIGAIAAFPEHPGSVPSTHMVAYNHLQP